VETSDQGNIMGVPLWLHFIIYAELVLQDDFKLGYCHVNLFLITLTSGSWPTVSSADSVVLCHAEVTESLSVLPLF
jgi:hypothetical protein